MICPKCKNEIDELALKCPDCNARVATLCKKCNAYNKIFNLRCTNCNEVLLKVCPDCNGVNLPTVKICRKCGHDFFKNNEVKKEQVLEVEPMELQQEEKPLQELENIAETEPETASSLSYNIKFDSQQTAKETIIKGLSSSDKKIISLSGKQGVGKSIVLKSAINGLKANQVTWLYGECNPITQLTPCGLIQDILLTFFNITNFCSDNLKFKKDTQKFFQNDFSDLTNEEIFNLVNFLYPSNKAYFEDIIANKEKTFVFLEKVLATIIDNNETVFVIDNFEAIDGMSYEFLHRLLNSDFVKKAFKILITYSELRPAIGYLYGPNLKKKAYLDIALDNFDKNQINSFINQIIPTEKALPSELKQQIYDNSVGNPAVLEQIVNFLVDYEAKNMTYIKTLPKTFNEIINKRLSLLEQDSPFLTDFLIAAAVQGIKFYPAILMEVFEASEDEMVRVLELLQKTGFVIRANDFAYTFKNSMLWSTTLELIKTKEKFATIAQKTLRIYDNYTLSSTSTLAVLAQNSGQKEMAFNLWTKNMRLASYIGDTNLYIISQKQCLTLIETIQSVNVTLIKSNIYERLGKLLTDINTAEALIYLPKAVSNAKERNDILKEIELTGYLANCCIKLGDYFTTIECIDSVIEKVDGQFELEIAMLKSRKLDALLNIGNCGQIINLVDNEIMPVFEKYINIKNHKNISIESLYGAWLKTYLVLANALVFQGNNRAFEVLATLFELFKKNEFDNQLFICKAKLSLAFAHTIKGEVEESEKILEEIIINYKTDIMDNEAISRWNFINIINNFIHKKYAGLKEELFQVVTFANNINDHFTKNILKTLLGKILKDEENVKKAAEIYGEQITYFAKEKNAIGALLCWYLIAESDLIIEGPEKCLEIAQKALEVAQGPKINNYMFIALYNKVIAEAYMAKSDYESAKVYLEKAIMISKKFEMLDLLAKLYLLYGKYLQDIALVNSTARIDYVTGASTMYKKAQMIAQTIKNEYILGKIEKAKTVLNSFCQLNGIILR